MKFGSYIDAATRHILMTVLILLFGALSLGMIVIAIPLAQRRVKPNPWYGFRTPTTLSCRIVSDHAAIVSGASFTGNVRKTKSFCATLAKRWRFA